MSSPRLCALIVLCNEPSLEKTSAAMKDFVCVVGPAKVRREAAGLNHISPFFPPQSRAVEWRRARLYGACWFYCRYQRPLQH